MGLPRLRQRHDPHVEPDNAGTEEPPAADLRAPARRLFPGLRRRQQPEDRILWQNGDTISTRLLHVILIAALISGPLALTWVAMTRDASPSADSVAPAGESSGQQTRDATLAAAAAQRLVLTWLTASANDRAAVQALLVEQLPTTFDLPQKRPAAPTHIWVGEVDQRSPGRYQVVVATVGAASAVPAYFGVPVRVENGVAAALSLPARTRQPSLPDPDTTFQLPALTSVATDDAAFQTAAGYVTALLTGSDELDRWTAPGTQLAPISPAACRTVHIDDVDTVTTDEPATRISVIATATCQNAHASPASLQYGLTLQVRDDRWEVLAEDPALLLDPAASLTEETTPPPPAASPPDGSPSTPN